MASPCSEDFLMQEALWWVHLFVLVACFCHFGVVHMHTVGSNDGTLVCANSLVMVQVLL